MDKYVAVSENVAKAHGIETIIKNPIDTELYKPTKQINKTPDEILAITEKPIRYATLYPTRAAETMPKLMNQADMVVTIGRGVLEAMSSARNVIIYDERPQLGYTANGYLDDYSVLTGNVGGSYTLKNMNLAVEIGKYNQEHGERNREYILKHHDVRAIVEQYLNL
jgi:hypothetical protein